MYLWLAVVLQPADDAGGEGVEAGDTDGGVEGLEQLVSYALELRREVESKGVGGVCVCKEVEE